MGENFFEFLQLLVGTVVHRPYVYVFFALYLAFALYHLGLKRTLWFTVSTYLITFLCEYSSTRNGFPFGLYSYFDDSRFQELWISNVPFWDSLSFVFLSYFSFVLASLICSRWSGQVGNVWTGVYSPLTPVIGGLLMMLLDVVIDPITLQGDKWFLGRIYNYTSEGFYFGVTAANFAGWFFVGFATQTWFQLSLRYISWCQGEWRKVGAVFAWSIYWIYAGIFGFNLVVTLMVQDYKLAVASGLVSLITLIVLRVMIRRQSDTLDVTEEFLAHRHELEAHSERKAWQS